MIEIKKPTKQDIDLVLLNEEVWNKSKDDNTPSCKEVKIDYDLFDWWGCYLDEKPICIAMIEKNNSLHFQVLKEFRKDYKDNCIRLVLSKLKRPVYCDIPSFCENVIKFAKQQGFVHYKENGIFPKDGENYTINKYILK